MRRVRFFCKVAFCAGALLLLLGPLVWLLFNALKTNAEIYQNPWGIPSSPSLDNFRGVWGGGEFGVAFWNSLKITGITVISTLALGCLAGYGLSSERSWVKSSLISLFLAGMMVPPHVALVPLFRLYHGLGGSDTHYALMGPYVAFSLPLAIFVMKRFFESIPRDILDAGALDGLSGPGALRWIYLPLSRSALTTLGAYTAIFSWNEFAFALTFLETPSLRTLPLALMDYSDQYGSDVAMTCAALCISVLPLVLCLFLFQARFEEALTQGALKG